MDVDDEASLISAVLARSKELEFIVLKHDPAYNALIESVEIVKKFIIDKGLIVYGGTAIDFALRLKGDNIYPDDALAIPDLDFYSPDSVEHAYQLADILYDAGFQEVRAMCAQHAETMRVDVVALHFIADITYRPKVVFDKIPYLMYNGMKIVHPDFQRVDSHSALSFPYDNPPREVIFARWNKDVGRFNKLAAKYPIVAKSRGLPLHPIKVKINPAFVYTGMVGYAILHSEYVREMKALKAPISPKVVPSAFSISNGVATFDALDGVCDIVHLNMAKLEIEGKKRYEPYINLVPERTEGLIDGVKYNVLSTHRRLVSVNSAATDTFKIRYTNVQYLLKYFLSMHFAKIESPKLADTYLCKYASLLEMIVSIESAGSPLNSALFPTANTYGDENINLSRELALGRLYNEMDGTPAPIVPVNYYPGRARLRGMKYPPVNMASVEFFRESGLEIQE